MNKSEQIKTKLGRVVSILRAQPDTRDDDRKLVAAYWRAEQPNLFSFRTADAVLRALVNRELASPDDITRARRKAQEDYPELRGSKHRQHERLLNEAEVRENINQPPAGELFAAEGNGHE
jgi:hypothetical protein